MNNIVYQSNEDSIMKRGKAVQNRLVSKSLQAILACAAIVLAPTVEAAAYYEAGARAWSYYLP
ncbi:MAG: hypothetical protein OEY27_04195, partial [Gammaproteobacteria bacterium]|nr:hypothetical protein [Gammaproteobacteria bacterium]